MKSRSRELVPVGGGQQIPYRRGHGLDQPMELVVVHNWVEELRDLFGVERW